MDILADSEIAVRLLYRSILGREPDPVGFDFHKARLDRGETLHEIAVSFMFSQEFAMRQSKRGQEFISPDDTRMYCGYTVQDLDVFSGFSAANPQPRAGFLTEFVGSRVRTSSLWDGCGHLDGEVLGLPIPCDYHAETIEWIGLLKAVLAAGESFSMMELGAGHGPWIAAGAAAAMLRGVGKIGLCAVEGDPGRFELLQENVKDNALGKHELTLIQGAVGAVDGKVRWPRMTGLDPQNNAGSRPLREGNYADETYLGDWSRETIEVELVALPRLLASRPFWDLVHMDVQGTEAELCAESIAELSERVRYLVIATHSRKLDGDVMHTLFEGGWSLEHEKPARMHPHPLRGASLIAMTAGDGTQVWRNPRY